MSNKPVFRNPDKFQVLPWREFIRQNLPAGNEGFVAEDLDLIVRIYKHDDPEGKFMLIELKYQQSTLNTAQKRTFGLIDKLLRKADPERKKYFGFYLVQYPFEKPEDCKYVYVNFNKQSCEQVT